MVTRVSCIVYHKFTHHPFRTKIKWRLPIPISEKHYKLIHDSGGANLPKFSWWEFVAHTTPRDVAEYHSRIHPCTGNREWSEPRCPEQEIFQGIWGLRRFLSSEVNHRWKEAPTASFTCEKRKGKQSCWCYLLSHIQSLMLLARKAIYTIWCYWISWVSLNNFRNHVKKTSHHFISWSSLASSLGIWHRGELCLESKSLKSWAVVELRMEIDYRRS